MNPTSLRQFAAWGSKAGLKAILDNAPLHTKAGASEVTAAKMIIAAAGAANVRKGHFQRFQHNKVFIKRDSAGKAEKVLFGSMNFSVRGIYVQANNVILVDDPTTAAMFAQAFDEAFKAVSKPDHSARAQSPRVTWSPPRLTRQICQNFRWLCRRTAMHRYR
jgi:phosphatidylserine/phosphatidylglycerophosphate/cardiolipin synthase-like enzyme